MIRAVDEALCRLLEHELAGFAGGPPRVVLSPPGDAPQEPDVASLLRAVLERDREPSRAPATPTAGDTGEPHAPQPALSVFLYDVRENVHQRERGRFVERDVPRNRASITRPPVHLDLFYAVSAHAQDPAEEHQLLSEAISALLRHPLLHVREWLQPDSVAWHEAARLRDQHPLPLTVAPTDAMPDPVRFWQSFRRVPRAVFPVMITTTFEPYAAQETPLVTRAVVGMSTRHDREMVRRTAHWVSVAGTVSEAADGEATPLRGALIQILESGQRTAADAQGFYYFLNLPPGTYHLHAWGEGRTASTAEVTVQGIPGEQYETVDFVLHPAALSGWVRRVPGSRPVGGATVRLDDQPVETDAAGYYAFQTLPAGEYEVSASAAGCTAQTRRAVIGASDRPHEQLDFSLHPAGLSGVVRDRRSGAPIPGARVLIPGHGTVVTGAEGRFDLATLAPGRYRVAAEAKGYETGEQHLHIHATGADGATAGTVLQFDLEPDPHASAGGVTPRGARRQRPEQATR